MLVLVAGETAESVLALWWVAALCARVRRKFTILVCCFCSVLLCCRDDSLGLGGFDSQSKLN